MLLSTAYRTLLCHTKLVSRGYSAHAAWRLTVANHNNNNTSKLVFIRRPFVSTNSTSSSFHHQHSCPDTSFSFAPSLSPFSNTHYFCKNSSIDFCKKRRQYHPFLVTQQRQHHQPQLPHFLYGGCQQLLLLLAAAFTQQRRLFSVRKGFTSGSRLHILLVRASRHYTTTTSTVFFAANNNREVNTRLINSMEEKKKVCIVGSGNWGSAIAKIIGNNVRGENEEFHSTVNMYVYEEMYEGRKLSEIINQEHENKKYLPGIKLPDNVVAVTDLATAADGADILVFVVPHQFIRGLCKQLDGRIKKGALAVSLIKGLDVKDGGGLLLISDVITECLSIPCHVLMGANLAGEVAGENYCEATVGAQDIHQGLMLKRLLQTKYFRLVVVQDAVTVEICGALKNIVAVGAGFADGLGYGDNTKAAVIRLGLMEMIKFVDSFYEGTKPATFLESCGVADLVTTCYGGRNRKVAEAMVKTGKSLEELEKEMLNGQKLQGPPTAAEVNIMLKAKNMEDTFPIFVAIHEICEGKRVPADLKEVLCNHPVHAMDTDQPYMRHFYGTVQDLTTDRCSYFKK